MRVLVAESTTSDELSLCLGQLFAKEISKQSLDSIHGLFSPVSCPIHVLKRLRDFWTLLTMPSLSRHQEGTFVPLSTFIATDSYDEQDLSLLPSSLQPKPKVSKAPIWNDPYIVLGGLFAFVAAYGIGLLDRVISFVVMVPFHFVEVVIEAPIKQIYRYGPSLFGWEGLSYPQICARITYHGDEAFWAKNLHECKKIFASKEGAVLNVCKPVIYIVLFLSTLSITHSFVKASAKSKPDPDMVATFKAFRTLSKQMKK